MATSQLQAEEHTFVLKSTANKVNLLLDNQTFEMHRNAQGQFFYKANLSAGMHLYNFEVENCRLLDPQNINVVRDCSRTYNYIIVGSSEICNNEQVAHGDVQYVWYKAQGGKERRLAVYLPPSYKTGRDYYPTLYLLHGTWGDETSWLTLGRAAQILDNLIAAGKAKEMIVVMPNCNMWQNQTPDIENGEEDFADINEASKKLTDGKFEEDFGAIINFIERQYRVTTQKSARAIAGLSRGGYFTMHISHYFNKMFDYIGLFSATYSTERSRQNLFPESDTNTPRVYKNTVKDLKKQFQQVPKLYYIAIGNKDFLYEENKRYRDFLDQNGYPYQYNESEGGHEWKNWRDYLIDFLPKLF